MSLYVVNVCIHAYVCVWYMCDMSMHICGSVYVKMHMCLCVCVCACNEIGHGLSSPQKESGLPSPVS